MAIGDTKNYDLLLSLTDDSDYEDDRSKIADAVKELVDVVDEYILTLSCAMEEEGETPPDVLDAIFTEHRGAHVQRIIKLMVEEAVKAKFD